MACSSQVAVPAFASSGTGVGITTARLKPDCIAACQSFGHASGAYLAGKVNFPIFFALIVAMLDHLAEKMIGAISEPVDDAGRPILNLEKAQEWISQCLVRCP